VANVTGWLDMAHGLSFKEHYYREGVSICSSAIRWGERRYSTGSDLPGSNACQKCLLAFSNSLEAEEGR